MIEQVAQRHDKRKRPGSRSVRRHRAAVFRLITPWRRTSATPKASFLLLVIGVSLGGWLSSAAQTVGDEATPSTSCQALVAATPEIAKLAATSQPGSEQMRDEQHLALIDAAERGDDPAVRRLLEAGASVTARDGTGRTALIAAAWGNHLDVACRLIEAGADVNTQDVTQQSAYLIATSEGYLELLRVTLDAGADVASLDSYNGTGLIRAAERGHADVVALLLDTPIAVDHVNRLGLTALLEAIVFGDGGPRYVETVRLLLDHGADPNLADAQGVTPLAHAQRLGFSDIAQLLERAGGR